MAFDASRFMRVYSNLPLNLRNEVIVVLDDKPITWNAAYVEVAAKTKIGELIVERLAHLGII